MSSPAELAAEAADLRKLLDTLPIYATRVGYRTDSTEEEQRIGKAAFKAYRAWKTSMAETRS